MNWRRRIVVSVALILLTLGLVKALDDTIKVDYCPVVCDDVRAGKMSWWKAFLLGCWCGDEPPQTEKSPTKKAGLTCQPSAPDRLRIIKTSR